jgi:hypothetical protein
MARGASQHPAHRYYSVLCFVPSRLPGSAKMQSSVYGTVESGHGEKLCLIPDHAAQAQAALGGSLPGMADKLMALQQRSPGALVHDLKVSGPQAIVAGRPPRRPLSRDSVLWLIVVAGAFLAAELTPALLRTPLGTDEITYIARTSVRVSGVMLPPVHGQGAGLLAAPVTLVTDSLLAIRVWMALLSAVGLFIALLCWRGLRPMWVLALAGLILASLAITQDSGVQIYPDWWGALGVLALTGLVLHAVRGTMRGRVALPLIVVASLVIVVMRPQNIVFIMGPAILAVIVVPGWRQPRILAAMAAGTVLGFLEWIIGAYVWYGGLAARLHEAGQEPPALRLYFSLGTQVKVLSGPWYCVPPAGCQGWVMPWETVWWALFLGVSALGLVVTWRTSARTSAMLAAVTALWVIALYVFLVPFGAPRYILPSLALMSVLAADAVAWLVTKAPRRTAALAFAGVFLLSGIISQQFVLQHLARAEQAGRPFLSKADRLRDAGVRPPCVVGSTPVAYYLGCIAPWDGESMRELLTNTPQGFGAWREELLTDGTPVYVPLASGQAAGN